MLHSDILGIFNKHEKKRDSLGITVTTLSGQTMINTTRSQSTPAARPSPVRAATLADVDLIHERLMEAIETSPHYSDRFKQYETARLSKSYLRNLIAVDPFHVMICLSGKETIGFMITGPELGTLWLYWSYIFPEKRRASVAMACLRDLIKHWDNGRFHKLSTYTRPGNDAVALLNRFKFQHTCTLENHIFGQDYMLYELTLTKVEAGYDQGMAIGRLGRIKGWFRTILGF